jgi:hypothetical protein
MGSAMGRVRWGVRASVLALLVAVSLACETLVHIHDLILVTENEAGCSHRQPPSPPQVTDAGGTLDLVFAVKESSSGWSGWDDAGRPRYQGIGFDLDNTCTSEGQPPSCVEPPYATGNRDGVNGIDNAYGRLWWGKAGPDPRAVTAATPTLLIRVRAYSGQPDDDQVDVSIYVGRGLAPRGDGGSDPLWDGNDRWNIMREMLVPSHDGGAPSVDEPQFHDDRAYVSGGVLVARFAEALTTPSLDFEPNLLVRVHQVVLAGSLTQVDGQWALQNVSGGERIGLNEALTVGAVFRDIMTNTLTCTLDADYQMLRQNLCPNLDVAAVSDSPSAPCDAMSIGLFFQMTQALLGEVLPPSPFVLQCAPGIDPKTDTCDSLLVDP